VPIIETNARSGLGLDRLKNAFSQEISVEKRNQILTNESLKQAEDLKGQEAETKSRYAFIAEFLADFEQKKPPKAKFSDKLDAILVHPIFGYAIFASILLLIFQLIFAFASYPMDWIDATFGNLSDWTASVLPEGVFSDL